jgi:hypothetical protein
MDKLDGASDSGKQLAERSAQSSPGLSALQVDCLWLESDSDGSGSARSLRISSSCALDVTNGTTTWHSSWQLQEEAAVAAAAAATTTAAAKKAPSLIHCRDDSAKRGSIHQQKDLGEDPSAQQQQQQQQKQQQKQQQQQQQQHMQPPDVHKLDVKTIAATVSDLPILAQCCLLILEQMLRSALAVLLPAATGAPTWLVGVIYMANVSATVTKHKQC